MSQSSSGQDLWAAVVAADAELTRCRADFYRHAASRADILAVALTGPTGERASAMHFLRSFPEDVPALLEILVENVLSHRWGPYARDAIVASGRRPALFAELRTLTDGILPRADADDFLRISDLLTALRDWSGVAHLARRAAATGDPEIREIGADLEQAYGSLFPPLDGADGTLFTP
ncbi:hypothetical protein [Longispora urticae]